MKREFTALAKTPSQIEAKALVKAMNYRREYLAASSKEIDPPDTEDTISNRGIVLEDIRYDWELREKSGEEIADRFIKLATDEVTPLAGLPKQWLAEVKGPNFARVIPLALIFFWMAGQGRTAKLMSAIGRP